jgi:hypothetical protein
MATNYSLAAFYHPYTDPRGDAFDAQREADRWRLAARIAAPTEEVRQSYLEKAEHYQACADRHNAQAKAGAR